LSDQAFAISSPCQNGAYFGCTFGLPPGLPGGGITGIFPASGVGARISGSMPEGGHSTPFDFASLSPSGSDARPVVEPCGAPVPRGGGGAHSVDVAGAGGAVCAGGVAGDNGACACEAPESASNAAVSNKERLIRMQRKRFSRAVVPGEP
jgi:hypothetical protein